MTDRLNMMLNILLRQPTLINNDTGAEYVVSGFEDDGKTVLLIQTNGKQSSRHPQQAMRITSIKGLTVKEAP